MQRDSLGQYSHERLSNGINVFCVQNELPHQNIDFILHAGSATDGSLPGKSLLKVWKSYFIAGYGLVTYSAGYGQKYVIQDPGKEP